MTGNLLDINSEPPGTSPRTPPHMRCRRRCPDNYILLQRHRPYTYNYLQGDARVYAFLKTLGTFLILISLCCWGWQGSEG